MSAPNGGPAYPRIERIEKGDFGTQEVYTTGGERGITLVWRPDL